MFGASFYLCKAATPAALDVVWFKCLVWRLRWHVCFVPDWLLERGRHKTVPNANFCRHKVLASVLVLPNINVSPVCRQFLKFASSHFSTAFWASKHRWVFLGSLVRRELGVFAFVTVHVHCCYPRLRVAVFCFFQVRYIMDQQTGDS